MKDCDFFKQYVEQQAQSCGEKTMRSLITQASQKKSRTSTDADYVEPTKIGQGTFGEVFKVTYKANKKQYALKKMKFIPKKEGFPIGLIRELRLLMSLKHENIVELKDFRKKQTNRSDQMMEVCLIFELCQYDLAGLLNKNYFTLAQRKSIMQQLLTGLNYIHEQKYIHRDLKSANILLTQNGIVKIGDFGLSRMLPALKTDTQDHGHLEPNVPMSPNVITLWYRAPELLLGYSTYSTAADMWGTGCIMAELWLRQPLFKGNEELAQLKKIIEVCGPITKEVWPDIDKCTVKAAVDFAKIVKPGSSRTNNLLQYLANQHVKLLPSAQTLLESLLHLNPQKRFSCQKALASPFFTDDPPPGGLHEIAKLSRDPVYEMTHRKRVHPDSQGVNVPAQQNITNNFPQPMDSVRTIVY